MRDVMHAERKEHMQNKTNETRVDQLWKMLKNNKLIAALVVFGSIVIAAGQITGALQSIMNFTGQHKENKHIATKNDLYELNKLFNKIHSEYKRNFSQYLEYFEQGGEPRKLIEQLTRYNQLTADDRARLIRLVKKVARKYSKKYVGPGIDGNETYQLILRYFGYSVPEYEDAEFTEYRIGEQRWRTSIKGEIETIINEWWQAYFNPDDPAPNMSDTDIKNKIDETWHKVKKFGDGNFDLVKFKKYLIRDLISNKIVECQKLAIKIEESFDNFQPK